jgi:hypothetical protein
MINIAWNQTTDQAPELTRQDIGFSVHCADDVTGLDGETVDAVGMDHWIIPVISIREKLGFGAGDFYFCCYCWSMKYSSQYKVFKTGSFSK